MGQQVNRSSKVKSLSESDYINIWVKLLLLDPKPGDLSKNRLLKDRTGECCIILRRFLESGEMPI
jgi:hypothetical protein